MRSIPRKTSIFAVCAGLLVAAAGCGGGGHGSSAAEQVQLREANMIFYSMPG